MTRDGLCSAPWGRQKTEKTRRNGHICALRRGDPFAPDCQHSHPVIPDIPSRPFAARPRKSYDISASYARSGNRLGAASVSRWAVSGRDRGPVSVGQIAAGSLGAALWREVQSRSSREGNLRLAIEPELPALECPVDRQGGPIHEVLQREVGWLAAFKYGRDDARRQKRQRQVRADVR